MCWDFVLFWKVVCINFVMCLMCIVFVLGVQMNDCFVDLLFVFEIVWLWLCLCVLVDFDVCIEMDCDFEVMCYIVGLWYDFVEYCCFVMYWIMCDYLLGFGYWLIFEKVVFEVFIGWILLIFDYKDGLCDVEIGWWLVCVMWGCGIVSEVVVVVVWYVFDIVCLLCVIVDIVEVNSGLLNVVCKFGMWCVSVVYDGIFYICYCFECNDLWVQCGVVCVVSVREG